ncbi:MAG TPA: FAD:protein FMN transferase [Verrucomicrobiales bacterium]|nr:FAD:protein FMN transferase [Verrucomicrobiales bacterium]
MRLLVFISAFLFPLTAFADGDFTFRRPAMGTVWTIKLYAPDGKTAKEAADAAFARVEELNGILSDYLPESELSRLSATAGAGRAVTIKRDLMTVLELSQQAAAESGGVFDITIGPCVQLWRTARRTKKLPAAADLKAAVTATGWESLVLDPKAGTALLKKPGMKLDAGGIAKGFAQDEAMKVLKEKFKITSALIDCGSPLVSGRPPGRESWNVQIAQTGEEDAEPVILGVENACVDTSGDLNQFVEIDGVRYSHIIDKNTGLGLQESTQATVVAPTAALADWLSTALCVMGPDKSMEYMRKHHPELQARVERRGKDGAVTVKETEGFGRLKVKAKGK